MTNFDLNRLIDEAGSAFNEASALMSKRNFAESIVKYKDAINILLNIYDNLLKTNDPPQDLLANLKINLHNAYYDLGNCNIDKKPPDYNNAVHSFLNALSYSDQHPTRGDLLYCMGFINYMMSATVMEVSRNEFDSEFVGLHNNCYNLL